MTQGAASILDMINARQPQFTYDPSARSPQRVLNPNVALLTQFPHGAEMRSAIRELARELIMAGHEVDNTWFYDALVGRTTGFVWGRPPFGQGKRVRVMTTGKSAAPVSRLDALLAEVEVARSGDQLETAAAKLRSYPRLHRSLHRIRAFLEFVPLRPRQRWLLMDVLGEAQHSQAAPLALEQLRTGDVDEYLLACTVAVRCFKIPDADRPGLLQALWGRAEEFRDQEYWADPLVHMLLRETLSSFSSFGRPQDVAWLLRFLEPEQSTLIKEQAMYAMERILARSPDRVRANVLRKLRQRCSELLEGWSGDDVLCFPQVFALASQVVALLCARLGDEMRIALDVICTRRLRALAEEMLLYIQDRQRDFERRGLASWVDRRGKALEQARSRLSALL